MPQRGQYAKGVAKREEILSTALDVIARNGFRRASVKELAEAVGLSQAGLLHYFSSKEELFEAILRLRDERDTAAFDFDANTPVDGLLDVVRHNAEVPGLVHLYAQLSTEAGDENHPSHAYFRERYERFRSEFGVALRAQQEAGEISAALDTAQIARLFLAASDGLQTQWMLDPTIDMAESLAYLWELVTKHP